VDAQLSLRLPTALRKRLDSLVPRLAADPKLSAQGTVKSSVVVRLALELGLTALERKYPKTTKRKRTTR
jgi:hypothetical protein